MIELNIYIFFRWLNFSIPYTYLLLTENSKILWWIGGTSGLEDSLLMHSLPIQSDCFPFSYCRNQPGFVSRLILDVIPRSYESVFNHIVKIFKDSLLSAYQGSKFSLPSGKTSRNYHKAFSWISLTSDIYI